MFRELLANRVTFLSSDQLDQLQQHYELLLRWNKVINLTRIEDVREAVERHYAESLFAGSTLPPGQLRIADVGSGAGFPGVPIAILRPECSVTLIESHQRKSVFLKEASRTISNIKVLAVRAENVNDEFDWVVSRAVSWRDLHRLALAPDIAYLGSDAPPDSKAFSMPGGNAVVFHVKQVVG